jgi:ABC-type nickel/cobalt efflux system permease component RcnA
MSDESAEQLRAEHDALAERLASRRSIDHVRRGAYGAFLSLVTTGLAIKLAYDRWVSVRVTRFKGPPMYLFLAAAGAALLVAFTAWSLVRAVRLMRTEDVAFARMRELRARLGLDS